MLPHCTKDIAELQDTEHAAQKAFNRHDVFLIVLNNLRFLVHQELALRGDGDEFNNNFVQLLHLRGLNCGDIDVRSWLAKKTNKYTSPDVQNEYLELMTLHILCDVSKNIAAASCFSVMADEYTEHSNKEQFTVNIRWVDNQMKEHESFIGLYKVDTNDADTLVSAITDVLLRMNVNIANCRGQCYDGASNMSGIHKGVAKLINLEESRAIYMHCYGHTLNLAVGDCMKSSKICKDTLDTSFEITRLIKFSPKRNAAFE